MSYMNIRLSNMGELKQKYIVVSYVEYWLLLYRQTCQSRLER